MLIPRRGLPRELPFPYDLYLSTTGYMLGYARGDNGRPSKELVSTRPADLTTQVVPTNWDLDAENPLYERSQSYGPLPFGMGLKTQSGDHDQRYYYALNADLASGLWLKGPAVTSYTPGTVDATVGITRMFELAGKLYALNGRYAQQRVSDSSWTVSKDFGSGKVAADAIVHKQNTAGSTQYAYVGMGANEPIYKFDGATWTQHAEAALLYSLAWARVGRDIYAATANNTLSKVDVDADPFVQGNWRAANAFYVGDAGVQIQRLAMNAAGALVVFKRDGIYSVAADGEQVQYYPDLQFAVTTTNGEAVGNWGNDLYVTYNDSTFRLKPDFTLEEIGPERLMSNDSVVRGTPTAFAGHGTLNLYSGWYNADSGNSYLCKLGGWIETKDAPAVRVDAWHGSITTAFTGKKITCLYKSAIGAPSGHSRLYLGFSDGSLAWFTLPCTPNPAACNQYTFSTDDGEVYLPQWISPFASDVKALKAYSVRLLNGSASDYVQLNYRTDPAASWTDFGNDFDTVGREKVDFASGASATILEQKVILKNTGSSASPQVVGVGLHWRLSLDLTQIYTVNILVADGLFRRDGVPVRGRTAKEMRDALQTIAAAAGDVACVFPDTSNKQVGVVGFAKRQAWDERLRQWRESIELQLVELRTNTVYGTYERMESRTYGEMESYVYSQIEAL